MHAFALLLLAIAPAPMAKVTVIETGPAGSEFAAPAARNALELLPSLLASAESTLEIGQMYMLYYPPESRGRAIYPLYDAIIAAAQRGVRVRILLDSVTLEGNSTETYRRMRRVLTETPGIEVRTIDLRRGSPCTECLMHAKYFVVDSRLAVVGSHNWSYAGFSDNVELSLAVNDAGFARAVWRVFDADWRAAGPGSPTGVIPPRSVAFAVDSPGTPAAVTAALARVAATAETTLDICVNSLSDRIDFGPGRGFRLVESLLGEAVRRGVGVRLLVDQWALTGDDPFLRRLDSLPGVEVRVIDLRRVGPNSATGTMHAKLAIADHRLALVGSATLSQRQLLECRNIGALVGDSGTVAQLRRLFDRLWFSVFSGPLPLN